MQDIENWKPIPSNPLYEISDCGRVKSHTTKSKGTILKTKNVGGYPVIDIKIKNKKTTLYVHKLVALLFSKKKWNTSKVIHIDNDKTNNLISNLKWSTSIETFDHAKNFNKKLPITKLSDLDILKIQSLLKTNILQKEIAQRFNISECM